MLSRRSLLMAAAAATCALHVAAAAAPQAQEPKPVSVQVGPLTLHHPHTTLAPIAGGTAAVYVQSVDNRSSAPVAIVAASSPAATRVELHTMHMEGNVMKMREIPRIEFPAGTGHTTMAQGASLHLMFIGLKAPLLLGQSTELEIELSTGHKARMTIPVLQRMPSAGDHSHHHHHEHHQHMHHGEHKH